jgi:uncharacterized protein YbcC (UPF0753/DUF2309 family)
MISEEDYKLMKDLVKRYENNQFDIKDTKPYIYEYKVDLTRKYNKEFGDNKECECGHPYYRHFDTYEDMEACGCKYCGCYDFTPSKKEIRDEKLNQLGI